jgi:hypothetical protein
MPEQMLNNCIRTVYNKKSESYKGKHPVGVTARYADIFINANPLNRV